MVLCFDVVPLSSLY